MRTGTTPISSRATIMERQLFESASTLEGETLSAWIRRVAVKAALERLSSEFEPEKVGDAKGVSR